MSCTFGGKKIASGDLTSYNLSGTAMPSLCSELDCFQCLNFQWVDWCSNLTSYKIEWCRHVSFTFGIRLLPVNLTSYCLSGAIMSASFFGNWIASGDVTFCGLSGAVMPASFLEPSLLLVILPSYNLSGAIMPATLFGF